MATKRNPPRGSVPIHLAHVHDESRRVLLAHQTARHLFLYRRQENWYYQLPKVELLPPAMRELWEASEGESRRLHVRPEDVLRGMIAQLGVARRVGLDEAEGAAGFGPSRPEWEALGGLLAAVRRRARAEGRSLADVADELAQELRRGDRAPAVDSSRPGK